MSFILTGVLQNDEGVRFDGFIIHVLHCPEKDVLVMSSILRSGRAVHSCAALIAKADWLENRFAQWDECISLYAAKNSLGLEISVAFFDDVQ